MKKNMLVVAACLLFPLFSCLAGGASEKLPIGFPGNPVDTASVQAPLSGGTQNSMKDGVNALVVYFSWSGNTRAVASEIQRQTGADILELIPEQPYTEDYNELLNVAQRERRNHVRPAIAGRGADIDAYDVIFLGYPNWWADMPMIIYTFLDQYDLSGKVIAPFCTSGGSGLSGSVGTIRSLEPESQIMDGLHVSGSSASRPGDAVAKWLAGLGMDR
ncbi:MAG: flavodoxin [Sphaerochaetaceae bacterium]|nr:flavodoxin [Sphaerochaetaceae bacterium]